jgi:hypothetical protein
MKKEIDILKTSFFKEKLKLGETVFIKNLIKDVEKQYNAIKQLLKTNAELQALTHKYIIDYKNLLTDYDNLLETLNNINKIVEKNKLEHLFDNIK